MNYIIPLLPLLQDIETKLVLKKLALAGVRQNSLLKKMSRMTAISSPLALVESPSGRRKFLK